MSNFRKAWFYVFVLIINGLQAQAFFTAKTLNAMSDSVGYIHNFCTVDSFYFCIDY